MKTILPCWVRIIALLVLFALNSHFDSCHADPISSWNRVFFNSSAQITSMTYGNGSFVGSGGGLWFISHDGSNWTINTSAPNINQGGVAYGNGMFLAFGTNYQYKANYILQSTNGTTWTTIYTSSNTLFAAAYGNNTWVFVGANEIVTATVTSSNWSWSEFQPGFSPACITYGNGVFVIGSYIGGYYWMFSSSDGFSWNYDCNLGKSSGAPLTGIVCGNGVFVASFLTNNNNTEVLTSSNLVNWDSHLVQSFGASPYCVAFGGNHFITSLGQYGKVYTSSDGYTWFATDFQTNYIITLTYGQGTFVATTLQPFGSIYQSEVFATQSNSAATTLGISTYPGVTINGTPGAVYQIQYSADLNTWQTLTNFILPFSQYIWIDTSSPVIGQKFYRSIQLQ